MVERYPAGDDRPEPVDETAPVRKVSIGATGVAALLVLVTFLTFVPVLDADFVTWDDPINVTANPYINPVTPAHLVHLWTHAYQKLYVPVAYTAYAAVAALSHARSVHATLPPLPFHLTSLCLHVTNTILVFCLLRRWINSEFTSDNQDKAKSHPVHPVYPMLNSLLGPLAGALLFALHPIQVETVAWVSELRGALAMTLALLALRQYTIALDRPSTGRTIAGALFFALALLAKPSVVGYPLIALAIGRLLLHKDWKSSTLPLIPWMITAAACVLSTRGVQPIPSALHTPLWERPLIAVDAAGFYLGKLLCPVGFCIDYGHTPAAVMRHPVAIAVEGVVLAVTVFGIWRVRRTAPTLTAAGLLSLFGLLPNLGLVPFVFQMMSTTADRYAYPAMIGPALAAAWAVSRLGERHRPAALASVAAVIAALAWLSGGQARTWKNSATLFGHCLQINPNSFISYNNLGSIYQDHGDVKDASTLYAKAIDVEPNFAMPYANLASLAWQAGQSDRAISLFRVALGKDPDCATARSGLALALMARHDYAGAHAQWTAAIRLAPDSALARYYFGETLRHLGREREAEAEFRDALVLQPSFDLPRLALDHPTVQ